MYRVGAGPHQRQIGWNLSLIFSDNLRVTSFLTVSLPVSEWATHQQLYSYISCDCEPSVVSVLAQTTHRRDIRMI